jgi:hypothetical protein
MLFLPRWWWHFIVAIDREAALQWRTEHGVIDEVVEGNSGVAAGVLGKRKQDEQHIDTRVDDTDDPAWDCVDFSFSVSFWWGARILKD